MTQQSNFGALRRASEVRVRIFTGNLVIDGTVLTVKEKPRLSDTLNDSNPFLNVTDFECFSKVHWSSAPGSGQVPAHKEKGKYVAVGKNQIEALYVVDTEVKD